MDSQLTSGLDGSPPGCGWRLAAGTAMRIRHGRLQVVTGRVWLTRRGDLQDHVLESGQTMAVSDADAALIETWGADGSAVVSWRPPSLGRLRGVADAGIASALRVAAALCAATGDRFVHAAEILSARARLAAAGAGGRCSA